MANNLWEQDNTGFNCSKCGIDEPFFMPLQRYDMIALRFQIPYYLINYNGGGIPVGPNVRIDFFNEAGTVNLCTLGAANSGTFAFGRINDTTNKLAEYQFFMPVPFKDEIGDNVGHGWFDVNAGQRVLIIGAYGGTIEFTYGVDVTPPQLMEVRPGRLVFPYNANAIAVTVSLDNTPIAFSLAYTAPTCAHENFDCFRIRLTIVFALPAAGTRTFWTKPFKVQRCDEPSIKIHGIYPAGAIDCNQYIHNTAFTTPMANANNVYIRIPADLTKTANKVSKTYNQKCFAIKTEKRATYSLNSLPVPDWFANEAENVMQAKDTYFDNLKLQLPDVDNIFTNSDVQGMEYQNLALTLEACKCELVFSC